MADKKDEVRQRLEALGLQGVDEVSIARLAKLEETDAPATEKLQALLTALGAPRLDDATMQQLLGMMESAASEEDLVDSIFIGPCPKCGSESTHSCDEDPGIEDPTVGRCDDCKTLFCSECETLLTLEKPTCENPACWLNQPDDDLDENADDE